MDKPSEPGNDPIKITVTVRKKGDPKVFRQAYLKISLPQVSKNRGVCGNWPKQADDQEDVAGQDQRGDGITLYNEYRGLVVLTGKQRTHKRLSPTEKEMFILDPDESFPDTLWKDRAGIEVLRLDESLSDAASNADGGPLVNFNASDRDAHPFFALLVKTIQGDTDATPPTDDKGNTWPSSTSDPSAPLMAYAVSNGTLRSANYIKVFPARARLMVSHYRQWLDLGLKDPASVLGQELRDPKNLFSVDEAFQAWSQLENAPAQETLVRKMLNVFFLHEVGHICGGLPEHRLAKAPEGHKEEARACFMWNPSRWDLRRMIVFTALGRGDSNFAYAYSNFCKDMPVAGFQCYRSLKVKDW